MSAELETHGGKQLIGKIGFSTRSEAFVESFGEHRSRRAFFDRRLDSPAAFA